MGIIRTHLRLANDAKPGLEEIVPPPSFVNLTTFLS